MLEKDFKSIVEEVKTQIETTQFDILTQANTRMVNMYFNIGKIVSEHSSWGNKFVDNLAIELKLTFPNSKGFSIRNLKSMKKFYEDYSKNEIMQSASFQIPWSFNTLIMTKVKEDEQRLWYINEVLENGWNYDTLLLHLDTDIYNRQVK